jgi:predicted nuclease of predicted toxin-antitoxin system
MSSLRFKFLLDENVRRELYLFLKNRHTNVKTCPKGLRNGAIAKHCLSEGRTLVTNDEDFSRMSAKEIYSVVWLKIPQNDPEGLIKAFSRFLDSAPPDLKGTLITLLLSHHKAERLAQTFTIPR